MPTRLRLLFAPAQARPRKCRNPSGRRLRLSLPRPHPTALPSDKNQPAMTSLCFRRQTAALAFICFGATLPLAAAELNRQPFRPQFHFTPERNWMNDPNGMVFYQGEYHLFYQSNPFGDKWGHMSWAHAVSRDLVHWKHLPLALAEEDGVMIFSGSAVVDWKNTSGF